MFSLVFLLKRFLSLARLTPRRSCAGLRLSMNFPLPASPLFVPSSVPKAGAKVLPFPELASTFFNYFSFILYTADSQGYKNAAFFVILEFHKANSSKKGCFWVLIWKVLAGSGGWSQVLPSNFPGYINGRTLLYIGSILSRNLNTWRA